MESVQCISEPESGWSEGDNMINLSAIFSDDTFVPVFRELGMLGDFEQCRPPSSRSPSRPNFSSRRYEE